ncbi:MAG: hybrid sensor histidine kinase/response regulator [Candidatus Kapaibacterium sp.]|nr:MAG: hybrid sensor histidine kinase/response regulator [Candidatus Kapabacteria bacterium]
MLKIKKIEAPQTQTTNTRHIAQRTLLLVDDEPGILLLLSSLFAPHYTVRTAESGADALRLLHDGYVPQVIIADQRMPGMTGAQFLGESRKILPNAVRVTLTGYTDIKEIVDSVNSGGIYRFVGKPWEDVELLETVRLCFEQYDLSTKNAQLEAALARVEALNAEKNEIMGIVSHDLKNPISAVLGMTDLFMPNSGLTIPLADYPRFMGLIQQTAKNMLELVKGLLDDYWLESGKMELHTTPLDVSTLIHFIVEDYQQRATTKEITLHCDAPDNTLAFADERRLHQVLDNLISNAVKYSPPTKHVFVRTVSGTHTVRIEIQDQGPGLNDDDKSKLFGKFARLSAQPTGGEHSSGLGLSIVKKMVEAMNGTVWCESEFGHGATFILELYKA